TDDVAGTFAATVILFPGANHVTLTLSAQQGTDIVSVRCAIDLVLPVALIADAGPSQAACAGAPLTLDASRSVALSCASPHYRWLDCAGAEVCPPGASPACPTVADATCDDYVLELSCDGE